MTFNAILGGNVYNVLLHFMVETLSVTFNAILGGNVYNVLLHVNAATLI